MARWSWLILAFYVVLAVSAQESVSVTPKSVTKIATSSTTKGTTTAIKTTTEYDAPTTEPATTTTTATTTTAVPTTTTVPTTAAPTPEPPRWPKNIGKWNVTSDPKKNVSCLVIFAALEINLQFTDENNKSDIATVLVPPTATAQGTCGQDEIINLSWTENVKNTTNNNRLSLTFTKDQEATQPKGYYSLVEIVLTVYNNKEGSLVSVTATNQTLFQTPLTQSYKCSKETPIKVSEGVELRVSSLQLEAFRETPFTNFSAELECSRDDVSAVVPFAVGASLALLVVIVLIAYLIGRRRSRARGYQSV